MATQNRLGSWYTDSTYNADEGFENSPFATDPRTFPVRDSLSSTAISQPYAMIPLPNQFHLYTIEEKMNLEEDIEPCLAVKRRHVESLAVKNGDLIEKSLKSISLIRSRLLQQQESNRKKNCEFQQIRNSLEIVHSLVHLVHDDRCNKTWIEFSTDDYKISSNMKNLKLSKVAKEMTFYNEGGETLSIDEVEPKTPTRISVASSYARSESSAGQVRSFKAMSITTNVPTTPTKPTPAPTPTSEIYRLYHSQSSEDLTSAADLTSLEQITPAYHQSKPSPAKAQESYYKTQLSKFNLERSTTSSTDQMVHAEYKNSPSNLSSNSVAVTLTTAHDDEWDQHDDMVNTIESGSTDERSENSSLRKLSIGPNQSRMMALKLKQFTRSERNNLNYSF
ncbi:hypothetical protein PGTUg99_027882 [Puccinia graminis f. sp. tritici]|uniref:Uncharacterized protein n=1 Tax=Puccinia graminis f. sp. tritici TaxID=56615 RepID=A0A5B0SCA4_PUCGR|nr:hypothetical protein PGTUg99_027882 [Puccinia graminis f. sp. tritici]